MRTPAAVALVVLLLGGTDQSARAGSAPDAATSDAVVDPHARALEQPLKDQAAIGTDAGAVVPSPPPPITIGGITGVPGDPEFERRMREMITRSRVEPDAAASPATDNPPAGAAVPNPPPPITIGGITGVPGDPEFERRVREMITRSRVESDAAAGPAAEVPSAGAVVPSSPPPITIGGITGVPGDPEFERRVREIITRSRVEPDAATSHAADNPPAGAVVPSRPPPITIGGITGVPGDPEFERQVREMMQQQDDRWRREAAAAHQRLEVHHPNDVAKPAR